jgi:hypothetical protein
MSRLAFDDRLLNRYTVEDLEKTHPALFTALQAWFKAFSDFDDTSLANLASLFTVAVSTEHIGFLKFEE